MIGKPSSPVRREAARKRANTIGTSPRGRPNPLALSAALGYPFVTFGEACVRIEDDARLYRDPYGRPMRVSETVRYQAFVEWLHEVISW